MNHKINIIGSGIGALAAACQLAAANYNVRIFEKQPHAGGKSHLIKTGNFWSGISFPEVTYPGLLNKLFQIKGKYLQDYIELSPLDPYLMVMNENNQRFSLSTNEFTVQEQIAAINPIDVNNYIRMNNYLTRYLHFLPLHHQENSHTFSPQLFPFYLQNAVKTNLRFTSKHIDDEFLQTIFSSPPLLSGCDPQNSSSLSLLYHKLDRQWGAHYPIGGYTRIISALLSLAIELGCRLHLNSEVDQILTQDKYAYAVRFKTDNSIHQADYILSDAGTMNTYNHLLSHQPSNLVTKFFLSRMKPIPSRVSFHFSTNTLIEHNGLQPNNLIILGSLSNSLTDILSRKKIGKDLILQICLPGLIDPTIRKEGGDFLSIHIWVPNLSADIDWSTASRGLRSVILDWIERQLLPGLRKNIKKEYLITPDMLAEKINRPLGTANDPQCSFMHLLGAPPANYQTPFRNLFLVGEGAHYLPGLSGTLSSARLAVQNITQ